MNINICKYNYIYIYISYLNIHQLPTEQEVFSIKLASNFKDLHRLAGQGASPKNDISALIISQQTPAFWDATSLIIINHGNPSYPPQSYPPQE